MIINLIDQIAALEYMYRFCEGVKSTTLDDTENMFAICTMLVIMSYALDIKETNKPINPDYITRLNQVCNEHFINYEALKL